MDAYSVRHYVTDDGKDVFANWLIKLRDSSAKIQIVKRINRLQLGNFGDHKFCRHGVWELRLDNGPGYRVYYAVKDSQCVLLLCGGTKDSQDIDIEKATIYWKDWQERSHHERQGS